MIISIIAAMNEDRVIGLDNRLPWHLPADLNYFKKVTMGKPILMGRKTYDSIGKPLPGRKNIVVTRDKNFPGDNNANGLFVAHTIDDALHLANNANEIFIIGGASFYKQMLAKANRLYLTLVFTNHIQGDSYFPEWKNSNWVETLNEKHAANDVNPFAYQFLVLKRND